MPSVLRVGRFKFFFFSRELTRIQRLVEEHREYLLEVWNEYFRAAQPENPAES